MTTSVSIFLHCFETLSEWFLRLQELHVLPRTKLNPNVYEKSNPQLYQFNFVPSDCIGSVLCILCVLAWSWLHEQC